MKRFAPAVSVAAVLVATSPAIGEIRSWIRSLLSSRYELSLNLAVASFAGAAIALALWRIRERRGARFAALGAAVLVSALSAMGSASGNASQDAVERFHFVEYGLITYLFYLAFRVSRGGNGAREDDPSLFVLPVVAALLVGTLDEWVQWFVPRRVGELRDIFLNGGAIAAGLLFSLGVSPPSRLTATLSRRSASRMSGWLCALIAVLAAFIQSVHAGTVIAVADVAVFRSHYSSGQLDELMRARGARWRVMPPVSHPPAYSREDQVLAEAIRHVETRNQAWGTDVAAALGEQRILEKFYAPVAALPEYAWPAAQRDDAETRANAQPRATPYESHAEPEQSIVEISVMALWCWALGLMACVLAAPVLVRRHGVAV